MALHTIRFSKKAATTRQTTSTMKNILVASLVTRAQIDEYRENGFICLRRVFGKKWRDLAAHGYERNKLFPGKYHDNSVDENGKTYWTDICRYKSISEYLEFAKSSPAAEIAGRLMESSIALFLHDEMIAQDAGFSRGSQWHQDQPYAPIDGEGCSIWMPIFTPTRGAIKFIKGSHLLGVLEYDKGANSFYTHEAPEILEAVRKFDKKDIVSDNLEPGDCIVFNMKTIHSVDFTSPIGRKVLVTRWAGEDAIVRKKETYPPPEVLSPNDLTYGDYWKDSSEAIIPWRIKE